MVVFIYFSCYIVSYLGFSKAFENYLSKTDLHLVLHDIEQKKDPIPTQDHNAVNFDNRLNTNTKTKELTGALGNIKTEDTNHNSDINVNNNTSVFQEHQVDTATNSELDTYYSQVEEYQESDKNKPQNISGEVTVRIYELKANYNALHNQDRVQAVTEPENWKLQQTTELHNSSNKKVDWSSRDLYNLDADVKKEFFQYKENQYSSRRDYIYRTCQKFKGIKSGSWNLMSRIDPYYLFHLPQYNVAYCLVPKVTKI